MKIGFTGTRVGATRPQLASLRAVLAELKPTVFHHGACLGADTEAVNMLRWRTGEPCWIVAHPGEPSGGRKNEHLSTEAIALSDEVRVVKAFLPRNRDIVEECDLLVACPIYMHEIPTGGTWYTIKFARKRGKRIVIVWPDGTRTEEGA